MRKFGMLMLVLLMASVMAVPAFAQGNGSAASTTNWVALTAGFAIALARDWQPRAKAKWRRRRAKRWDAIRQHGQAFSWRCCWGWLYRIAVLFTFVMIFLKVQ